MTTFQVGELVVARVTAQGMTKGERYLVADIDEQPTPFGSVVTYWLQRGDDRFPVVNLHVLADGAPKVQPRLAENEVDELRRLYVQARAKRVRLAGQLKKQPRNAGLKAKLREAEGAEDRREWAWHTAMHASNASLASKSARS